jgi:hypothetical protein
LLLPDRTIPRAARLKWLTLLRHHKVKLAISSRAGEVHIDGTAPSGVLRPFPRRKGGKQQQDVEEEVHHAPPHAGEGNFVNKRLQYATSIRAMAFLHRSPDLMGILTDMKPSEMIAHGLATGELSAEDVQLREHAEHEGHPPAPPTAAEEAASAATATEAGAGEPTPADAQEEDSDRESDYEPEGDQEVDSGVVKKKLDEAAGVAEEPEPEEEEVRAVFVCFYFVSTRFAAFVTPFCYRECPSPAASR